MRASRILGPDRMNTRIGPFEVKVLEGLQKTAGDCGVEFGVIETHRGLCEHGRSHGRPFLQFRQVVVQQLLSILGSVLLEEG